MVDYNKYGWTYAQFHSFIGWDKGTQLVYEAWENLWSRRIDAYIFLDIGTCPRLTDANEKAEVGDIVNEMMVVMNIFLKAESNDSPMMTGFYTGPGFPQFKGERKDVGTGHFLILNKYRRRASASLASIGDLSFGT